MSPASARAYRTTGRPGVPPERLLRALLPMALCSVRSERPLCERIDTDLLFRWSLDRHPGGDAFGATTLAHNRKRLGDRDPTKTSFAAVVAEAIAAGLCGEHLSVDGTMIESFASAKSFQPKTAGDAGADDAPEDGDGFKPRNAEADFHGEERTSATHEGRTDPEGKSHRKGPGKEARLGRVGRALGENRNGLIPAVTLTGASGTAERTAALEMPDAVEATHAVRPTTLGADEGFDGGESFQELESRRIEPHVPLVREPCDPASAAHRQRKPGVAARRRMKARVTGSGSANSVARRSRKCSVG